MKIISYRRSYFDQIIELNKKLIPNWFDISNLFTTKSKWENLNSKSRFIHGGPWYDPETLEIHLKSYLKFGQIRLIINDSNEVLGLMEFHHSKDQFHIDWIIVRPSLWKKGLGSNLITDLKIISTKQNISRIKTEAEKGVQNFYNRNGFKKIEPFYRYLKENFKNTKKSKEEISLKDLNFRNIYGEANNSIIYLKHMISTSILYNELFEDEYPLHKTYYNNKEIIIRDIPGLKNRSSIFTNFELNFKFDEIMNMSLESGRMYFITTSHELSTNWSLFSELNNFSLQIKQKN